MSNKQFICAPDNIQDGTAKGFYLDDQRFFILHKNGYFFAYINSCPHLNIPLEWQENEFICKDTDLLRCSTHGALFLPESGLCVSGPCAGQHLKPLKISVNQNGIFLS